MNNMEEEKNNKNENDSIWSKVLSQVSKHKVMERATIIVLGDKNSGKKSLFGCMREVKPIPGYSDNFPTVHPLGYTYLDVIDPDEEKVKTSFADGDVWFLNDPNQGQLLDYVLQPERAHKTIFVIALDLSKPWDVLSQLNKWLKVIRSFLTRIKQTVSIQEKVQKCSQQLKEYIRLFRAQQILGSKLEEELKAIELPEGVLTENLGIPIIICGTKVDMLESSLAGKKIMSGRTSPLSSQLQPKINFMQLKLRETCLALAASLIFTSAIENVNTITLQKYIFHRLYMDEFKTAPAAEVLNPNSLFIPAGWDALESLEDIVPKDGPINKNLDFDIVIPNTSTGSITETKKKDETVTAYPEDVFLQRLFDKQVKDDRLSSSGVSDAKLRGAMSEMSDQSGSTLVANTSRSKQSRRKSLADAIGKASAGSINSKSSSNSSSSRSSSGKNNSSKKSNNVNPSADPKENPKLIKNFFQSLLKEPRKTSRAGSRAKKKG
jgi:dynein light intermediate chain 1, cytosolic